MGTNRVSSFLSSPSSSIRVHFTLFPFCSVPFHKNSTYNSIHFTFLLFGFHRSCVSTINVIIQTFRFIVNSFDSSIECCCVFLFSSSAVHFSSNVHVLLMKRLITLKIHYNEWMNEWCLHVSVKRKSIYARTRLLNTVHGIDFAGLIELNTYHDDAIEKKEFNAKKHTTQSEISNLMLCTSFERRSIVCTLHAARFSNHFI